MDPQQDHQFRWDSLIQNASVTFGCWFCGLAVSYRCLLVTAAAVAGEGRWGHGTAVRCCGLWVAVFYCETSATLVSVAKPVPLHLGSQLVFFYSLSASSCISWLLSLLCISAEQCEQPSTSWEKQWKKKPYSAPVSSPLLTILKKSVAFNNSHLLKTNRLSGTRSSEKSCVAS